MNELMLKKLEEAFAMGCSDKEACLYAGIAPQTLYNYQHENEEFLERKETLKLNPVLLARQTIIKALRDPLIARWFLERKCKDEFGKPQDHMVNDEQRTKIDELREDLKVLFKA